MAKAPEPTPAAKPADPLAAKPREDQNTPTHTAAPAQPRPTQAEADAARAAVAGTAPAEKPDEPKKTPDEPAAKPSTPSPTQAELDAMREGQYGKNRDAAPAGDSAPYKTR